MIKYIDDRLSLKILIAMSAIIMVVFGGIQWYSSKHMKSSVLEIEADHNLHFADVVKSSLSIVMRSNSYKDMSSILEDSVRSKSVDYIDIIDDEGVIRHSSHKSKVDKPLKGEPTLRQWDLVQLSSDPVTKTFDSDVLISIPLWADETCLGCHHNKGDFLGAIMLSRNMDKELVVLDAVRFDTVVGFGLALLITITALHILIQAVVLTPLKRVLEGARKLAKGDLTSEISLAKSEDEVHQIATTISTLRNYLRDAVTESLTTYRLIDESIKELDSSSQELLSVAMEQSGGAAEQAASVHEVTSTAQEIAATSSQISTNVISIRSVAEETFEACVRGRDNVSNVVNDMEAVKNKVRVIAEASVELGRKSGKIGGIVSIIDDISEQTHLLALNAAIEAAGAGEHGKRFSVVAAEVRRLAERTVEATSDIKGLIEEIQESTNETVMVTEAGAVMVLDGASKVDFIGESLEGLLTLVMRTKDSAKEMAVATQQQALAGDQLVMTISDINGVAIQVSRAAEQVEKSVLRLKGIARRMSEITARDHGYDAFRI